MRRAFLLLFFVPSLTFAQLTDAITFERTFLLRNISGTSWNPGPAPHHAHLWTTGDWSGYDEGSLFGTYVTETGPVRPETKAFSTNWFGVGAQRTIGSRGLVLFRVRGSLEPFTIPQSGYPQLLQQVPLSNGGLTIDRMRAQNLIGEAAAHLAYRVVPGSFVHLYAGAVGDPPLGTVPFAQRASSEEFAEAPFAYATQESFHEATRVVTAGVASRALSLEGGVFHNALSSGRHTSPDDGNIDSWAARATLSLTRNTNLQFSRGKLGDAKVPVTTASLTYGTEGLSASAIWTRREAVPNLPQSSFGFELLARGRASEFMARAESVDLQFIGALPASEPISRRTHVTLGGIVDVLARGPYRTGVGLNIDYHSNTRVLTPIYGHKPQSIYTFVRIRTNAQRR